WILTLCASIERNKPMNPSCYCLVVYWMLHLLTPRGHESPQRPEDGPSDSPTYVWTQLTPDAGYSKSYNYQLFSDDQYIRAFHHDGVWLSKDGITWWKTELTDIVNRQAFLDYVKFKGAIYALGTFAGNIEHYTQTTQIAKTS